MKYRVCVETYRVVIGGQGGCLLDLESFVEDLLGEDLVLDHIHCLRQALILLALLRHRLLHLHHRLLSFLDLRLAELDVPRQRLDGHFEVLDDLGEGGQLLDLDLRLLLVDVDHLDLAALLGTGLQNPQELLLVSLDGGAYKYTKADPLQNALFERNPKVIHNSPIGNE